MIYKRVTLINNVKKMSIEIMRLGQGRGGQKGIDGVSERNLKNNMKLICLTDS